MKKLFEDVLLSIVEWPFEVTSKRVGRESRRFWATDQQNIQRVQVIAGRERGKNKNFVLYFINYDPLVSWRYLDYKNLQLFIGGTFWTEDLILQKSYHLISLQYVELC